MNDMSQVIIPKSDQINAEDFLAGPRTYRIENVAITPGQEQPVSIKLENEPRVWRPCKSMSRCLVAAWGPDAKVYVGRSLTLYRDPTVKWGGMEVGGIRIGAMSDIKTQMVLALTATKGSKKPFTVKPLVVEDKPKTRTLSDFLVELESDLRDCGDGPAVKERLARDDVAKALAVAKNGNLVKLQALMLEHRERAGLTQEMADTPDRMET